jgi:hypothetical protein
MLDHAREVTGMLAAAGSRIDLETDRMLGQKKTCLL